VAESPISFSNDEQSQFLADGKLDLIKILIKFQSFMFEEYRQRDENFYESQARLIFLAYLKPIINGNGFYFIEPQTRENKRLDIVIILGNHEYVIELKIWNGEAYEQKAYEQLADYLNIRGLPEGYLLTFSFNKNKRQHSQWVSAAGKKIFEVIV
jgi:hypothetical protein